MGTSLYALRTFFVCRPRGISGTANEPFWARIFLDELGLREDREHELFGKRVLLGGLVLAVNER